MIFCPFFLNSIWAEQYQTVSLNGSTNFVAIYSITPTCELCEDGGAPDAVPEMPAGFPGSAHARGGPSNDGHIVILYDWDSQSDLVTDLDYLVWGDKAEAVDKTGVSIDVPDADAVSSPYLADTAIASQDRSEPPTSRTS